MLFCIKKNKKDFLQCLALNVCFFTQIPSTAQSCTFGSSFSFFRIDANCFLLHCALFWPESGIIWNLFTNSEGLKGEMVWKVGRTCYLGAYFSRLVPENRRLRGKKKKLKEILYWSLYLQKMLSYAQLFWTENPVTSCSTSLVVTLTWSRSSSEIR